MKKQIQMISNNDLNYKKQSDLKWAAFLLYYLIYVVFNG